MMTKINKLFNQRHENKTQRTSGNSATTSEMTSLEAFHLAVEQGDLSGVERLIGHISNSDAPLPDQSTPLDKAASLGHLQIVKLLLANKADANQARQGFVVAIANDYDQVVSELIDKGIKPGDLKLYQSDNDHFSKISPLHLAIDHYSDRTLKVLLNSGYSYMNVCGADIRDPLWLAAHKDNFEAFCLLIQNGEMIQLSSQPEIKAFISYIAQKGDRHEQQAILDALNTAMERLEQNTKTGINVEQHQQHQYGASSFENKQTISANVNDLRQTQSNSFANIHLIYANDQSSSAKLSSQYFFKAFSSRRDPLLSMSGVKPYDEHEHQMRRLKSLLEHCHQQFKPPKKQCSVM